MTDEQLMQVVSASGSYPPDALRLCAVCTLREDRGRCGRYGVQRAGCHASGIPLIDLSGPEGDRRIEQALQATVEEHNRRTPLPGAAA
ncbi:MAG TPA: hypothetical protein VFL98_01315 [Candidatus Paceibacterota bacterium]|nr:hypothetical protein [Candidatus Paceibacterota bacterium]